MAQTFRLVLRIQSKGEEVFENTADKIKSLNTEISKTSTEPFEKLLEFTKSIEESVSGIEGRFQKVIGSLVRQTSNAIEGTTDNIAREAGRSFETILSRLSLGVATILGLELSGITASIQNAALESKTFLSAITRIAGDFKQNVGPAFNGVLDFAIEKFHTIRGLIEGVALSVGGITTKLADSASVLPGIGSVLKSFSAEFGKIAFGVTTLAGGAATFFGIRVALKETVLLFRRFTGQGIKAATPLERISNIVFTVDSSIRSIGLTTGSILKSTLLLGGAIAGSVANPLFGIVSSLGFVNSAISNVQAFFTRSALRGLAFFGSARSQLGLIFFNLKQIADKALPELERKSDALKSLGIKAEEADKTLKKVSGNLKDVQKVEAVKRTRFPLAAQFQQFSLEIKTFLTDLVKQVNLVTKVIQKAFGVTDVELKDLEGKSKKVANTLSKSISEESRVLDNIFSRNTKGLNILDRSMRKVSNFFTQGFTTNPLAKALKQANKEGGELQNRVGLLRKAFSLLSSLTFRRSVGSKEDPRENFRLNNQKKINQLKQDENSLLQKAKANSESFAQSVARVAKALQSGFGPQVLNPFRLALSDLEKQLNVNIGKAINKVPKRLDKLPIAVSKTPPEVQKIGETIDNLKTPINRFKERVEKIPLSFGKIEEKVNDVFSPKTGSKQITGLQKELVRTLQILLDIRKTNKDAQGGAVFGSVGDATKLKEFVSTLEKFRKGSKTLEDVQAKFDSFGQVVSGVTSRLNSDSKIAREGVDKLFQVLRDPRTLKEGPKDIKAFEKAFDEFAKSVSESGKKFGTEGQKVGLAFTKQFTQGFKDPKNKQEIENSILLLIETMMEFFPRSPAKRGPLKALPKSGREIGKQLSGGLKQGKKDAAKGAEELAKQIAGYFPQSPALFGPLRFLFRAGTTIARQLAEGMRRGLSIVADAANAIGKTIFDNISRVAELQIFSNRFGVSVEVLSSFNLALADVGASTQDFQFALTSLNRVLGKTLTEEESKKFKALGLDIDSARRANEPTVALFLQLADVLKGLPPQSQKFTQTLEAIGLTVNSSIVNVLQKGSAELIRFQDEAIKAGTVTSSTVGILSKEFNSLVLRFGEIKNTILNGFIEELLPEIINISEKFLNLFEKNRKYLELLLRAAGKVFAEITRLVGNFSLLVVTEPRRAFELLANNFLAFGNVFTTAFTVLFNGVLDKITGFFSYVEIVVKNYLRKTLKDIVFGIGGFPGYILRSFATAISSIFFGVKEFFGESFKDLLTYLQDSVEKLFYGFVLSFDSALKSTSIGKYVGDALGLTLSDKGASEIKGKFDILEDSLKNSSFSLIDTANKVADGVKSSFNSIVKSLEVDKAAEKKARDKFFGSFFGEDSKKQIQKSLDDMKNIMLTSLEEVSNFELTNTDLSKSFEELGDLFKEKVGGAAELVFGEDGRTVVNEFFNYIVEVSEGTSGTVEGVFRNLKDKVDSFTNYIKNKVTGATQDSGKEPESFSLPQKDNKNKSKSETGLTDKDKKNPFAATAKYFNEFFDSTGEKAEVAGARFTEAFKQSANAVSSVIAPLGQTFELLYETMGKKSKAFFIISKAIAIADATVRGGVAIVSALSTQPVVPVGIAAAATTAALVATQIAAITATTIQQAKEFAQGGLLTGPSHASGGIPIRVGKEGFVEAEGGEYILSREATKYAGLSFLERLNAMSVPREQLSLSPNIPSATSNISRKFERGGLVGKVSSPNGGQDLAQAIADKIVIQNVNVQDEASILKITGSSKYQRQQLNFFSNNSAEINRRLGIS